MTGIHGGDIYRNQVRLDFSVNTNPFGIPKEVKAAIRKAVEQCKTYPDIAAEELRQAVSDMLAIPKEYLLFGNGASELFMAIVHGVRPKRTILPVPSFYGYEYAVKAGEGELIYYETKEENNFCITPNIYEILTDKIELLFLANPNNPVGNLISRDHVREILSHCRDKGIYVVLDECFIEFCGNEFSLLSEIDQFKNLILVRAFTKSFSIPGVRLGYLVCSDHKLLERIGRQLPEWNLSTFAQAAGCACAVQSAFLVKSADYIKKERQFLESRLKQMGFQIYPSNANFILIYSKAPLYERLLEKGILIRDCGNFKGLRKGFYRIAVKSRRENEMLLKMMGEEQWEK